MFGVCPRIGNGNLMGAKCAFDLLAIHPLGASPALERIKHDHRPPRADETAFFTRLWLDAFDFLDRVVQRGRHGLVHEIPVFLLYKNGCPTVAARQLLEFLAGDPGEDSGIEKLVTIEMEDRQDRTIGDRIEEFVGMPCGGQWAAFCFAIADLVIT